MQALLRELRTSLLMTAALALLVCGVYPVLVYALAQGSLPTRANGSIIFHQGTPVGSSLLGQPFNSPRYFHPRPSAGGYDGTASGGTNLGPTSKALLDSVEKHVANYRQTNGLDADTPVPVDAVAASASGLDPHISVDNAILQAPRVAQARGRDANEVIALVRQHAQGRTFGILGEPRVNVLLVNLALDEKEKREK